MGFKPGATVTVDNALKMLMVKSANDIAVVLAEGVSGSVEKFSDDMNGASRRLGMTQSSWVNPNGLPAENQISSARDLGILARAMLREFPEYDLYWNISAIKFGKKTMRNYNTLIGRYAGADGMKTGFICASGFNLVASASRHGKRLIAVVLGAPSSPVRAVKAAALLERGFNKNGLAWLTPSLGTVDSLAPIDSAPPDLREEMCGPHRKRPAAEEADDDPATSADAQPDPNTPTAFMLSSLPPGNGKPSTLLGPVGPAIPIVVYAGASKKPAETQFAAARAKLGEPGKNAAKNAAKNAKASQVAAAAPAQTGATPQTMPDRVASATPAAAAPGQIAAAPATQTISAPPPGAFAPPAGKFTPTSGRTLPAVADTGNAPWMSFAPAARADTAPQPLTAAPAPQLAAVPMPRPRPKAPARKPEAR
jgi:D-alanyl-D-alanine carboxypeptidase